MYDIISKLEIDFFKKFSYFKQDVYDHHKNINAKARKCKFLSARNANNTQTVNDHNFMSKE